LQFGQIPVEGERPAAGGAGNGPSEAPQAGQYSPVGGVSVAPQFGQLATPTTPSHRQRSPRFQDAGRRSAKTKHPGAVRAGGRGMAAPGLYCTGCGAPRAGPASFCASCGRPFPAPSAFGAPVFVAPPDSYQLVGGAAPGTSSRTGDRQVLGIVLLIIGVVLLVVGIGLLVAASLVSGGVSSYNNICSMNPSCVPQSDPSGGLTVGGIALLVLGGALAIGGFVAVSSRR
jgi:hypothetical protein